MTAARAALVLAMIVACGGTAPPVVAPIENQPAPEVVAARQRVGVDEAMARFPADNTWVFQLDVARLRDSVLWPELEPMARQPWHVGELFRACGLDFWSSLDTVWMSGGTGSTRSYAVVRGFSRERLTACAAREVASDDGRLHLAGDVIEVHQAEGVSHRLRFIDDETFVVAVLGDADDSRAALDRMSAARPGDGLAGAPELRAALERVEAGATLWMIFDGSGLDAPALPVKFRHLVFEARAGAEARRALDLRLLNVLPDEDAAQQLTDLLKMFVGGGMGAVNAGGGPIGPLLAQVVITPRATEVDLALRVDLAGAQQIMAMMQPLLGGP